MKIVLNGLVLEYVDVGRRLVREQPSSFSELLRRLEAIQIEYSVVHGMPFGVDLVRERVGRLVVGLSNGQWLLMFHPADAEAEPTIYSLGDVEAEGTVRFYLGDASLMSRKYLVPQSDSLRVLRAWFEEGVLGDGVNWTDRIF
jgi:hypothetical protein